MSRWSESQWGRFLLWIAAGAGLAILILLLTVAIVGAAPSLSPPAHAALIGAFGLPCEGGMLLQYDTNDNSTDGAELVVVQREDEDRPRGMFQYDAGEDGRLLSIRTQIPGGPIQTFTSVEALVQVYSTPCDLIRAELGLGPYTL